MAKIENRLRALCLCSLLTLACGAEAQLSAAAAVSGQQPPPASASGSIDPNAIRVLLSPELETTLVAQMPGRIATLNAQLGAPLVKGRLVVGFECSEALAKVRMAEAEFAAARETLETKQNLRRLDAAGDVEVSLAKAAADRANAAIGVNRAQSAQCSVLAPFSGRIARLYVKPHQSVAVGQPLVDLVSDGPLKLRLNVPSRFLRTLRVGQGFEVDIEETGNAYPARVTAINARVDAVAQTVELEARIDGRPAELLAGMTGVARFPK